MAIVRTTCNQAVRPLTATFGSRGWSVGGCALDDLVDRFGSPLYVMDEATIVSAASAFVLGLRSAYPGPSEILYASKALCNTGINRLIHELGLGTEVVSGGELATALAAGIPADRIVFQGNAKSPDEIDLGLEAGVGRFMVDNLDEIEALQARAAASGRQARILLRINPGIEAHTHEFIRTGHVQSKFGIRPGAALDYALERLEASRNLEFMGLQLHVGSQIFDITPFLEAADVGLDLAAELAGRNLPVRELDLGGGLGVAYTEADDPPSIADLTAAVGKAVAQGCERRGLPLPKLMLEPGRAIVATAGCTVYQVVAEKRTHERQSLLVDGGMADNPRPALYDAVYSCDPVAGRMGNRGDAPSGAESTWTVAGKACEEGDVLVKEATLPSVGGKRRLVLWTTGAYCFSMASNYNRLVRPAMVVVGDGQADLVRERESFEDLLAHDRLPLRFISPSPRPDLASP